MSETVLLDATETRKRVLQNGLLLGGALLIVPSLPAAFLVHGPARVVPIAALVAAVAGISAAIRMLIDWDVVYKGHAIRFENHCIRGERLLLDGRAISRGVFGFVKTLEGTLEGGQGAGDRIVSVSNAGLVSFSCRITATEA